MDPHKTFYFFTPEGKGIFGELDADGTVSFAIEAGPESSVRGTEMFNRMMDDFGTAVRAIRGVWNKGPSGTPSTNIDKVNELTFSGEPLEVAVLHTWTATRAKKRGFGTVTILEARREKDDGPYVRIEVLIIK